MFARLTVALKMRTGEQARPRTMQQYQVPQFITVEDKIIGPLTMRQFFYLLGGGAAILILYTLLNFYLVVLFGILIGSLAAAMAFLKIDERPFPLIVMNFINFYMKPRLYVWKHSPPKKSAKEIGLDTKVPVLPKINESKLSELAWSLDIHERVNRS